MRRLFLAVILVTACGDDESTPPVFDAAPTPDVASPPGDPDAGNPGTPDGGGGGGGLTGDEYDDPSDFADLFGCEPGEIGATDLEGIWHAYGTGDAGGFPLSITGTLRAPGPMIGGEVLVQGEPGTLETSSDDAFFRLSTSSFGGLYIYSFYACRVDDDGSLWGHVAECADYYTDWFGMPCLVGQGNAYPIRQWDAQPASGLALLGEHGDAWPTAAITTNVRVRDGLAYVSRINDGLRIVDVSDPTNLTDVGHQALNYANDVKLVERASDGRLFALVADTDGVHAVDVDDPAAPADLAKFPNRAVPEMNAVHTLFVSTVGGQTWAYTTEYQAERVGIWDVTDPASPIELGGYDVDVAMFWSYPHDLYVDGRTLYLNDFGAGLVIVDTTNPAMPVVLGHLDDNDAAGHSSWVTTIGGCKVALAGGEGWFTSINTVGVDESCPEQYLQILDTWQTRPEVSTHNIMVFGTTAYVAWYQDGVRVFDISNPADIQLTKWFNTWSPAHPTAGRYFYDGAIGIDLDLSADRMYVADIQRGLLVLDLNP